MIVDAHAHLGPWPRFGVINKALEAYLSVMDHLGVRFAVVAHHAALCGLLQHGAQLSKTAYEQSGGRILSYLVYDPNRPDDSLRIINANASRPHAVGIKIHPTAHGVPADDDSYSPAYEISLRAGKPILTHSWEASSYNPTQYLSHPDRFCRHLERHPGVRLVLGHAGGRPGTLDAVADICSRFPAVRVDLAGDYFDSGTVDALAARLGPERIIFASDADWIDPRCNLAAVFGSGLSDGDLLRVLRTNAMAVYGGG